MKEPRQPQLGDVGDLGIAIEALAGLADGSFVEVGREHLDRRFIEAAVEMLADQHRDGIGFLAGGAGRHPNPDIVVGPLGVEQPWDQTLPQQLEGFRVAKEVGHADQEVPHQGQGLVGLLPNESRIASQRSAGPKWLSAD